MTTNDYSLHLAESLAGVSVVLPAGPGLPPSIGYSGDAGSGKTEGLTGFIKAALTQGYDVALLDPMTQAIEYEPIAPWLSAVAASPSEAVRVLDYVVAEQRRRFAICRAWDSHDFWQLPQDVREHANIRPLLVAVEFLDYTLLGNEGDAIASRISQLLREARAVGIYIVCTTSRIERVPSGLRDNLTATVHLRRVGTYSEPELARIVDPGEVTRIATALSENPGAALLRVEGTDETALVRLSRATGEQAASAITAAGRPHAEKWELGG